MARAFLQSLEGTRHRGTFPDTSKGEATNTDTGFAGIGLKQLGEFMLGPLISEKAAAGDPDGKCPRISVAPAEVPATASAGPTKERCHWISMFGGQGE